MAKNKSLHDAARAKQDEFYTDIRDIENELRYYKQHFRDKIVLCNCDDPYESNFFKYFALNFNALGLKKLITTCYSGSPIAQQQLSLFEDNTPPIERTPHHVEITEFEDYNGDGRKDLLDIEYSLRNNRKNTWTKLQGNGDFRSAECIELLKQADIVVTNPPFSLLREYIAQLLKYNKKFLIVGNKNAVTYKEIFPLFMQNRMWMGIGFRGGNAYFKVPTDDVSRYAEGVYNSETERVKFRNCCWFTNLEHHRQNETIPLYCEYYRDPSKYPKYDNYDAIEVSKVSEIPCDYLPDYNLDKQEDNIIERTNERTNERTQRSITESWESQSPSLTSITQSNSKLSGARINTETPESTSLEQHGTRYSTAETSTNESSSGARCNGIMGVPITFLDKYNPKQFEIIGIAKRGAGDPALRTKVYSREDYSNYSDLNAGPVLVSNDGKLYNTYPRILIRRRREGE